jgi:glycosyltransferase involved in cell wall biosynthesis
MKNIIFLSEEYLYFANTAGVKRMNLYAKSLLLNRQVKIYMIPFVSNCNEKKCITISPNLNCFDSEDEFKRQRGIKLVKQVFQFLNRVNQFSNNLKGDVVFYYYPASGSLLDLVCVFYVKFYCKKNIYLEVNEVRKYASTPVCSNLRKIKRIILTFLLENTFYFYDGLICISYNIELFYRNKKNNILIVPILSDKSESPIMEDYMRTKDCIQRPIVFLFAGSVAFEKENLEELIKGFALILDERKDVLLRFYGSITEDSMNKINKLINKLNIIGYVEYCGPYDNDKVFDILKRADALVLPRSNSKQNYYGFSTKLAEYAVSMIPIIMTNTGVVSVFFEDGYNCIMLPECDAISFYLKFNQFLSLNKFEKGLIAQNAYDTALKYFEYEIYSDQINSFLK